MSEESSGEPKSYSNKNPWYNQPIVIAIAVFVGLVTAGLLISANLNQTEDAKPSENISATEPSDETTDTEPEKSETSSSDEEPQDPLAFSTYEPIFCDPETDHDNREKYVEENLQGERVQWDGAVFDVETISDQYVVVKLCNTDDLQIGSYSARISVGEDQKNLLLDLEKGDRVTFDAKIDRYRVSSTQLMAEGTITDHRPQ